MILIEGLLIGLVIGLLTGGRLSGIRDTGIRYESVFLASLAVQLVAPRFFSGLVSRPTLLLVAWILPGLVSLAVALLNRHVPGMRVVAAGILLNLAVVVLNSGMPVAVHSAEFIGYAPEPVQVGIEASWLHVGVGPSTRLLVLADVIPVPGPEWQRGLVSLGDVLMSAGVGFFVFVSQHAQAPDSLQASDFR